MPTADDLRALARSSPWLWRAAVFTRHVDRGWGVDPVRAFLRRPDALRVQTLDGGLVVAGRQTVDPRSRTLLTTCGGAALPEPPADAPRRRADGLVVDRSAVGRDDHDAPFHQDYHWVAMLDPVELADGDPHRAGDDADDGGPTHGTEVDVVREVEHGGRAAWSAVVRPTAAYDPRCGCCPLLHCAVSDRLEGQPTGEYAEAFRVVLDRGTGICVQTRELGGRHPGRGHTVLIEQVDTDLPDALFDGAQ